MYSSLNGFVEYFGIRDISEKYTINVFVTLGRLGQKLCQKIRKWRGEVCLEVLYLRNFLIVDLFYCA